MAILDRDSIWSHCPLACAHSRDCVASLLRRRRSVSLRAARRLDCLVLVLCPRRDWPWCNAGRRGFVYLSVYTRRVLVFFVALASGMVCRSFLACLGLRGRRRAGVLRGNAMAVSVAPSIAGSTWACRRAGGVGGGVMVAGSRIGTAAYRGGMFERAHRRRRCGIGSGGGCSERTPRSAARSVRVRVRG